MGLGLIKTALGQAQDQIFDRSGEVIQTTPDAGAFLQDWITTRLPEAVIGFATKVAGREDGSGFIANEALKAGRDPNIGALIK
jgi:hypothetical protein